MLGAAAAVVNGLCRMSSIRLGAKCYLGAKVASVGMDYLATKSAERRGVNLFIEEKVDEMTRKMFEGQVETAMRDYGMSRAMAEELAIQLRDGLDPNQDSNVNRRIVFKPEPGYEDAFADLEGEWILPDEDFRRLANTYKHRCLKLGIGEYAARLRSLAEAGGMPYDDVIEMVGILPADTRKLAALSNSLKALRDAGEQVL